MGKGNNLTTISQVLKGCSHLTASDMQLYLVWPAEKAFIENISSTHCLYMCQCVCLSRCTRREQEHQGSKDIQIQKTKKGQSTNTKSIIWKTFISSRRFKAKIATKNHDRPIIRVSEYFEILMLPLTFLFNNFVDGINVFGQ